MGEVDLSIAIPEAYVEEGRGGGGGGFFFVSGLTAYSRWSVFSRAREDLACVSFDMLVASKMPLGTPHGVSTDGEQEPVFGGRGGTARAMLHPDKKLMTRVASFVTCSTERWCCEYGLLAL